jgi:NAD(P)-dependent dehydrogenase (short-subunit alcohol dehydrogenase family)
MVNKRVIITGAASGIGLAVTKRFLAAGNDVAIVDIDEGAVRQAAIALDETGLRCLPFAGSVSDLSDVTRIFETCAARWNGIDVLVNNAGITGNMPALDLDLPTWQNVVQVNQTGSFLCAQAAGRVMSSGGGGVIINLSSIYGLVGAPNRIAYAATKGAIVMMTKALAVEWASLGIRVNCIAPGYVETPGTQALADTGRIDLDALRNRTPQRRLASADDIAGTIEMLAREEFAHVTGQILAVDGGWTAYGYL